MNSEVASTVRAMRRRPVQYSTKLQKRENSVQTGVNRLLQRKEYVLDNQSPSSALEFIIDTSLYAPDFSKTRVLKNLRPPKSFKESDSRRLADKMKIKSKPSIEKSMKGVERSNLIYQNFKTGEVRSRHLKLWNTKEERELGN